MDRRRVYELIDAERKRQQEKWAGGEDIRWAAHPLHKLAVLMEEVGEVAKDLQERSANGVRDELVQVGALAVRWLEAFVAPEDDPETCPEKKMIRAGSTGSEERAALEQIWAIGEASQTTPSTALQTAVMIAGRALGKVSR